MNTYNRLIKAIEWQPKALKQMRRIPAADGARIRRSVEVELVDLTRAKNVKALTNAPCDYRLRVGNYRVLFNVTGASACIVLIEEVRKRDERTY